MNNDPYGLMVSGLPPEMAAQARGISREQAIAEAMLQQSQQPRKGRMVGRFYVPTGLTENIAGMVQGYAGQKGMEAADKKMADLGTEQQRLMADEIQRYMRTKQGTPASSETIMDEQANGGEGAMASINAPAVGADPRAAVIAAMTSRNPALQRIGQMDFQMAEKAKDRSLDRDFKGEEARLAREARRQDLELRLQDSRLNAQDRMAMQRELVQMQDATRREIDAQGRALRRDLAASKGSKPAPVGYRFSSDGETLEPIPGGPKDGAARSMPTQALKLQQGELDAIGAGAALTADLAAVRGQLESGKLQLGPVNNVIAQGRNFVGMSDENSRNLASFQATLERLRNESLRLNKGVQTEGDAIRAWNELVKNINDPAVVKQRLGEIEAMNARAIDLRKMNVDSIRGNYGLPPMETQGYTRQPAAVGRGGAPAAPALSAAEQAELDALRARFKK